MVADQDPGVLGGEGPGDLPPDPSGRTGDQDHPVRDCEFHAASLRPGVRWAGLRGPGGASAGPGASLPGPPGGRFEARPWLPEPTSTRLPGKRVVRNSNPGRNGSASLAANRTATPADRGDVPEDWEEA
ncbi:hypothetical protein GCM10018790_54210 [Kitasatospora xanthocidica]|nr:hypothetical protein GCM10018790_54210 [Kitasatospora xanthocidica]